MSFPPRSPKRFRGGAGTEVWPFSSYPSLLFSVSLLHSFTTDYKTAMKKFTRSVPKHKTRGRVRIAQFLEGIVERQLCAHCV